MTDRQRDEGSRVSVRGIAGGVIALLVVVFVALNRDTTEVSFIVFSAETRLWVALALAAIAGAAAGFLLARRVYRD